jgi:hypothetical protein
MSKNLSIGLDILKKNMMRSHEKNENENETIESLNDLLVKYKLNNRKFDFKYNVWFHDANDTNFEIEGFNLISNINDVNDFIIINEILKINYKMLLNGMFFVMKDGIKPLWNDEQNKDGGCISWKIEKNNSLEYWCNFFLLFITNNLPRELNKYNINGISINPKKNCNIFKLWVGKDINSQVINNINMTDKCLFNNHLRLYKSFQNFI